MVKCLYSNSVSYGGQQYTMLASAAGSHDTYCSEKQVINFVIEDGDKNGKSEKQEKMEIT